MEGKTSREEKKGTRGYINEIIFAPLSGTFHDFFEGENARFRYGTLERMRKKRRHPARKDRFLLA